MVQLDGFWAAEALAGLGEEGEKRREEPERLQQKALEAGGKMAPPACRVPLPVPEPVPARR